MWSLWILYYLKKWASRTNKYLFFRPFFSYSRIPQVRWQAAGDQSCSWYFVGTFRLRETVAFETMRQFPSLGRTGFILLKCSPKNSDLVSQVRCASVCAALLMQNGHKPTWTCRLGWSGLVERAGGSGLLRPSCATACEEPAETAGSWKKVCICSNLQKQASFLCVQGLCAWFGLLLH